ncbi:MAG: hypothetical protein ACREAA_17255, partial [Candidatus Polarisedimenticolia bacterium]
PAGYVYEGVWTGSRMIIWGSRGDTVWGDRNVVNAGGLYDPATDTWSPMSLTGRPTPTIGHKAVWAGGRMVVFGGRYRTCTSPPCFNEGDYALIEPSSGGAYDPATNSWAGFAAGGRELLSAVSIGSEAVFWGGANCPELTCSSQVINRQDGFRYNPQSGIVTPISTTNAPSPRTRSALVWTGSELILWGGNREGPFSGTLFNGGRHRPASRARWGR